MNSKLIAVPNHAASHAESNEHNVCGVNTKYVLDSAAVERVFGETGSRNACSRSTVEDTKCVEVIKEKAVR